MQKNNDHLVHLSGERLYGDDMSIEEMEAWYLREKEGYSGIVESRPGPYFYEYHALNTHHCFSRINSQSGFGKVLGIGSAFGEEFDPIIKKIRDLVILDPSEIFANFTSVRDVPCKYVKPISSGEMPFDDNYFDLITSFGVMHHIPNVTFVTNEIFRCLKPGGIFLIREPIVSQGDWIYPRRGVTKDERGIPVKIFDDIIKASGFNVEYKRYCDFAPLAVIARKFGIKLFDSKFLVKLDDWICNLIPWKLTYHRTHFLQKLAPASVVYILKK